MPPRPRAPSPGRPLPLALLALAACARPAPPPRAAARVDPELSLARVRGRELPPGLSGKYKIRIEGPSQSGSTRGALLLRGADRLRVEVQTPLRTPLFTVATDGVALHAWSQGKATFYRGDDAGAVLAELTQGAVQISDLTALLTAGLPFPDAPVLATEPTEEGLLVVLGGPASTRLRATVDPRRGFVRSIALGAAASPDSLEVPAPVLTVDVLEVVKVGKELLPDELRLAFPTLGWTVELDFTGWEPLQEVPEVFTLSAPPGAKEADLVGTLKELAAPAPAP